MATISIKMKIIADKPVKEKINNAHCLFNKWVRKFEEFLLVSRGKDYFYEDENGIEQYKSVDEAQRDLEEYLGERDIKNIPECIEALKGLEGVIKSKGSQAAGMLAKLYNAESSAGMNNISKIVDPVPEWVDYYDLSEKRFIDLSWQKRADIWILSEEGKKAVAPVLDGAGRASSFKKAYTTGKEWYSQFILDQEKYRKDLKDGLSKMLYELDKAKALPLIDIEKKLIIEHPIWVKLMLKTALENYASYLACDETTRTDYQKIVNDYEKIKTVVDSEYHQEFALIDRFLQDTYIQTDRSIYLTRRMCRGLDDILHEWKKCSSAAERLQIINEWQSDKKRRQSIGDVNFLSWLAEDENVFLTNGDCISVFLEYYDCLRLKENKRCCASYTVADPISSKRYLFYENETGTNYRKYGLFVNDGRIHVKVPVLLYGDDSSYYEEDIYYSLAPNNQMENLTLLQSGRAVFNNGKTVWPKGEPTPVPETFEGKLGGADLRVETNAVGQMKKAFMSFTITTDDKFDSEWGKLSDNARYCFSKAFDGKKSKYDSQLAGKTLRALSIDLGLKQFGAAAVGEIVYPDTLTELPNVFFERMFLIQMAGEKVDHAVGQYRLEALRELRQLRSEIRYLSMLKRIYNQESDGREKLLAKCSEYYNEPDKKQTFRYCLNASEEEVNKCLSGEYSRGIINMNAKMKEFRSGDKTRRQKRNYEPGKSFWSISYLEELRKILIAWNSLGKTIDVDNKLMDKGYGVTATKLLTHIQNLKDDRIKTGADCIIQSALGYVYDSKIDCWIQKYEPCNIIIFEDLSRYRFSLDRPARENSKLMKWAHREIIEETKRQATIYGIAVYDSTDAAYSSKFSYKTSAPGIRCDRLGAEDFENNGRIKEHILVRLPEVLKKKADLLKCGSLVPSEIGSIFVTLDQTGHLYQINADMNAACNLQNRFWGFHTHLYRFSTQNISGCLMLKGEPDDSGKSGFGKRDRGKLLYHYGTDKVMLIDSNYKNHFMMVKKQKSLVSPEIGKEKVFNLFRDPSGIFFPEEEWIGYKEFWGAVEEKITNKLVNLL